MEAIGVIPARYCSSRFEGKVLADIAGKPMIQYVWERAKEAKVLDDVVIACDDERILRVAKDFGAKAVLTAKGHISGTDRIIEVINPLEVRIVVNIQADEPLINPVTIDSLTQTMLDNPKLVMATVAKRITDKKELEDPNVVKLVKDKNDYALYFSRAAIPFHVVSSEVENPIFYKHIGLYAFTKDFLFVYKNLPVSKLELTEKLEQLRVLEEGYRIKVIETEFDSVGVDTPEDLEKVRRILAQR